MRKRTSIIWTLPKDNFQKIIENYKSLADILRHFGLHVGAGNYKTLKKRIKEDQIDISHIHLGINHNKGRQFGLNIKALEDILANKGEYKGGGSSLKLRLIRAGLKQDICESCGILAIWNNKPITLQLDHIDGNPQNNNLINLQILCPNCHSQTHTWGGRNQKANHPKPRCQDCGKIVTSKSKRCISCDQKKSRSTKIIWPALEELQDLLSKFNYIQVGKLLGVSDNAIRKHIKRKI